MDRGANFASDSERESLVACYDGAILDEISVDFFGSPLPETENKAYSIAYHSFFFYKRVNIVCPYPEICKYVVYNNAASNKYLFTKYKEDYTENYANDTLKSETKLIKATEHNGKISLYLSRTAEFDEYSGGVSTYTGVYRNTYKKTDNGYIWLYSYGTDSEGWTVF